MEERSGATLVDEGARGDRAASGLLVALAVPSGGGRASRSFRVGEPDTSNGLTRRLHRSYEPAWRVQSGFKRVQKET